MAAAAGIFTHSMTAGQAFTGQTASPMDTSTNGTSGSSSSSDSGDSTGISANDFLTLLVTEMQNQDPTADTDPNEYIDQLVQVNSLEQLININQTLTTDLGAPPASTSGDSATGPATGPATAAAPGTVGSAPATAAGPQSAAASIAERLSAAHNTIATHVTGAQPAVARAPGNLSVPAVKPAAQRVAHALDGQPQTQPHTGPIRGRHFTRRSPL